MIRPALRFIVDLHRADLQPLRDGKRPVDVVGKYGGLQPIFGTVRKLHRLVNVFHSNNRQNWRERLLPSHLHFLGHAVQQGWIDQVLFPAVPGHQRRPLFQGLRNQLHGGFRCLLVDQGGNHRAISRITHLHLLHARFELLHQLVRHAVRCKHALDGCTPLAGIGICAVRDGVGGKVEVGILQHDGCVFAAEFQQERRHARQAGNMPSNLCAAGKVDEVNALMCDNIVPDFTSTPGHGVEHAAGQPCTLQDVRQVQGADGSLGGRLQNHRIAANQRRRNF